MSSSIALTVDVVSRINAAFHQNRIPVVGSVEVRNDNGTGVIAVDGAR